MGENATIGANCKIIYNDFHPLDTEQRRLNLNEKYTRLQLLYRNNQYNIKRRYPWQ